ncbi:hypothetical protein J2W91_002711 [Paenibacillus amylolyticus]|uniref:Uncharacterized protein n=1 Tax=Paenibacillus amylolyticus TaxID=1451 RepID=A0AAP5H3T5_PAEAM|nr:hypothetical protein [Paenibacillus amylolyticus]MDR6724243.1 hypothetical protein [Paenibacillus amylolyticus]
MNTYLHTNQDLNPNFGFALTDSAVLAEGKLIITQKAEVEHIELDIDPQRCLKDGRKVSVVAQQLDAPIVRQDASIIYGQELSFVQYTVNLHPDTKFSIGSIEGIDYSVDFGWSDVVEGEYELRISIHRKTPRIAEVPLEPEQMAMVRYAQVVTVVIALFPAQPTQEQLASAPVWTRDHHVFDSYGSAGFILADLPRMVPRVDELLGAGDHNLVERFNEGDLSAQLLNEGLMATAWGISPWCYSIYAAPDATAQAKLPVDKLGEEPVCTGIYRIAAETTQLSIIPANELVNWPACTKKEWPQIQVAGSGETLRMALVVQNCESVNGLHENPLPSFVITRNEGLPEIVEPLINIVIVD